MSDKERKPRTPRTYESIEKGALALPLKDRVSLAKSLELANEAEVKELQKAAADGAAILNGSLND